MFSKITILRNQFSIATALGIVAAAPLGVSAQQFTWFVSIISQIQGLLILLVPLLIALALALFIWGVVLFIVQSGEEKAREEGKKKMIWGIVALFVIVSVWGLVALLSELSGIGPTTGIAPPQAAF